MPRTYSTGFLSTALPAALLCALGTIAPSMQAAPTPRATSIDRTAALEAVRPSFVIVDVRLKQDRGDMPNGFVMGRGGFDG